MSKFLKDYTTKEIINKYFLNADKSFGQNFIINPSLTDKIVSHASSLSEKTVVEVGPGPACLTRSIISQGLKKFILIEKDPKFEEVLKLICEGSEEVLSYVISDVLDFEFSSLKENDLVIISNLPYNISTPFLIKACYESSYIDEMLLMFQKEVAERVVAKSGKKYGRLSVMAQSFFEIKKVMNVSRTAFLPMPKIESQILHFKRKVSLPKDIDFKSLEKFTKKIFSARRKKISTVIPEIKSVPELIEYKDLRAENLSIQDIYKIIDLLR